MTDLATENTPVAPFKRGLSPLNLFAALLFFICMYVAGDTTAIYLERLRVLQIPYPKAMDYAHFIIPGFCALICLTTVRKWPALSLIASVLLCGVLIDQIPAYANRRTARIPVSRFLTSDERDALKSRIAFPIVERASSGHGNEVFVASANEVSARRELLGL